MVSDSFFDPEALLFREATETERVQSWRNNSDAWRGKLSMEEYIGLQKVNANQELTRNGGIRFWILTDGTEIYCSAETLRKPIVVSRPAVCKSGTEFSYGIASVFTPPEYRRRGIASAMMRKLAAWFDSNDAKCDVTTLFSAVGGFYERFGWNIVPTQEIRIPILSPTQKQGDLGTSFLMKEDLESLCQDDVASIIRVVNGKPLAGDTGAIVAYLPTYTTAKWHFGSEDYLASVLSLPQESPLNKGATVSNGSVWCYWVHDFNNDRLTMLRLILPSSTDHDDEETGIIGPLSRILQTAVQEAANWGLKQIAVWDPDPRVLIACRHLQIEPEIRQEIENFIPCLRGKKESGGKGENGRIDWMMREAYQRC